MPKRSVIWNNYHIGISPQNSLFIGKGRIGDSGVFKWVTRSSDRTEEIITSLMEKMRKDCNSRKDGRSYVGYNLENKGTLLYIKPGYEFRVMKSADPKWKVEEETDDSDL